MKKVLELVLFTLFSFSALSQNFVSDNYQNFLDAENSTVVQVHGVTFQMAAEILSEAEGENAEEIREALKTIKSFQLLAMPDIDDPISEYTKGLNNLDNAFDELVNVKDNENRFSIQIDEEDGNAKVGACVEVEIDSGEKDSGAVEEIEVKKYSFLCSVYKFID